MQHSRLTVQQICGATVAELLDEHIDRLDRQAVEEISRALLALAPQGTPVRLLIDFGRVHFMGSTLLGCPPDKLRPPCHYRTYENFPYGGSQI